MNDGYLLSESSAAPPVGDSNWISIESTLSYTGSTSFMLSTGADTKTVYAWFKDVAGNVSSPAGDSIEYIAAPLRKATSIKFNGAQSNGIVFGTVTIGKASSESDIDAYRLYYVTDATIKSSLITELNATGGNLTHTFPNNTSLPEGTTHLAVINANEHGEMSSGISTRIKKQTFDFIDNVKIVVTEPETNHPVTPQSVLIFTVEPEYNMPPASANVSISAP